MRLPFGGRKHTNLPAPQLVDDGGRQLGAGPVSGQQQDAAGRRAGRAGQGGTSSDRAAGPVPVAQPSPQTHDRLEQVQQGDGRCANDGVGEPQSRQVVTKDVHADAGDGVGEHR